MSYPEKVKERARALRERGYSQRAIARELGVSQPTVGCWLNPEVRRRHVARRAKYNQLRRQTHPLYGTWYNMKSRCLDSRNPRYQDYGGRGIQLYPAWDEYEVFKEWVLENLGPRPDGHSLDRIDNDGNYEPGNLRWADVGTQHANRRRQVRNSDLAALQAELDAYRADLYVYQAELDAYRAKYGPLEAA